MKTLAERYSEEMAHIIAKACDDGAVLGAGIIKDAALLIQRRGGGIKEVIASIDAFIQKFDERVELKTVAPIKFSKTFEECHCTGQEKFRCDSMTCIHLPF